MRGVPLLNFEGGPGILLLNFEGGPGPTFTPCLEKNEKVARAFVIFHHFFKFTRSFFKCHLENVI